MTIRNALHKLSVTACLIILYVHGTGQASCEQAYRTALNLFSNYHYEAIDNVLQGCLTEFDSEKPDYLESKHGKDIKMVFKVYKMIITSYQKIDKDNLANQKKEKLIQYFHRIDPGHEMSRDEVENQLNRTSL